MKRNRLLAGVLACTMVCGAGAAFAPAVGSCITAKAEEWYHYEKCGNYYAGYFRPGYDVTTDYSAWVFCGFYNGNNSLAYHIDDTQKVSIKSFAILSSINEQPVTSIEDYAFGGCTALTSVTIPDSVTSIGSYVFNGCTALTNVTIPDSVTSIGGYAFNGCTALTGVTISGVVTSIAKWAFENCTALKSVTIPDSVTSIGDSAFRGCTSLTSVTIPDSVTVIKSYAFYGCNQMKSITIPSTITTIGDRSIGYTSAGQLIPGFVIYGKAGSAAEVYALANGLEFKEIGSQTTTEPTTPTEPSSSRKFGDIDGDGEITASDAAMILMYAAARGAGYKGELEEFLTTQ